VEWIGALLQQNNLLRYAYNVGGSVNTVDSASALTAATRLHFTLTRASDGTAVCFYVSGTLISTAVAGAAPSPSVTPTQLLLGGNLSGGDLSGVLDELAIYNGMAFPAWRIAQLYQSAVRV
jgi:hypothetical protein